MFDDPNLKKQAAPPDNLPAEPVDILSGTEKEDAVTTMPVLPKALDAGLLKKKRSEAPLPDPIAAPGQTMYAMKEPILGKIILFIFVVALLGGLGAGGWWLYGRLNQSGNKTSDSAEAPGSAVPAITEQAPPVEERVDVSPTPPADQNSSASAEMNNDQVLFGEPIDSDKDGLDDVREKEIGTSPNNPDTDGDGLNDGDEVIIWKTDPLNKDTDGDSYLDGDEVRHGYNPLGPGKLFNIPSGSASGEAGAAE